MGDGAIGPEPADGSRTPAPGPTVRYQRVLPGPLSGPGLREASLPSPRTTGGPARVTRRNGTPPGTTVRSTTATGEAGGHLEDGDLVAAISSGDDAKMAARNGLQLGGSLVLTWIIGLTLTNVALPHLATPLQLGVLGFCEAVASIVLAIPTFGLDTYIRKEVSRRSAAAREFVMGTLVARMLVSALFIVGAMAVLHAIGRDWSTVQVLFWFGAATFLAQSAEINAALLQAVGKVKGQARINVLSKTMWAAITIAGLKGGFGIRSVPVALCVSEGLKAVYLGWQAHHLLHIPFSLKHQRVSPVLKASLPFLASALAVRVMMWLDVTLMGVMLSDERGKTALGLYFSAVRLAQLALILAPVALWVLTPLASRALARSQEEFQRLVRRSFQNGITIALPLTALLALNSDVVIAVLQPASYRPASKALRVLAAMFVLTYLNILASTFLQIRGDGWVVVRSTIATIVVDLVLVLTLVPIAHRSWGLGGAGLGASIALIVAEAVAAAILMTKLGRGTFDRRSIQAVALTVFAVVCLTVIDRVAASMGWFIARTVLDVCCALGLVMVLRVYDIPRSLARRLPGPLRHL